MNSEKIHRETSTSKTGEHLIIKLGLKKEAKLFCDELKKAAYELGGELYDEEDFWNHITKKVRRSYRQSETDYIYENKSLNLFGNVDTDAVLNKTFLNLVTQRRDDAFGHHYEASLIKGDSDVPIINERRYESYNGLCDLTKTELHSDTVQKYYFYNFEQKKWDESGIVGTAFMMGPSSDGFIDIDCKNEDPQKVKDLFVRAITRLYAGIEEIEYGGTNNKRDDYLRDEVERIHCKPIIKGKKLHCELVGAYGIYASNNLLTYSHCFKTFMSRCQNIDFVAYVFWPGGYDTSMVFYTENGMIHKIDEDDWVKPYTVMD